MNPAPSWVSKARRSVHEGRAAWDDEDENDGVEEVLRTTKTGRSGKGKTPAVGSLPAGEIEVARLRDANQSDPTDGGPGPISSVDFHPLLSPILLTSSSSSRTLSLFRLQGTVHPHLHSFHIPDLPITKAAFEPSSGKTIFLGGQRPFFYSVDLGSQKCVRSSPRGLMGIGMGGDADFGLASRGASFETFEFAPDGKMVAVAGRNGHVHLLEWRGVSSQVVASVKANSTVKALAWRRGGAELLTVGEDAEVVVWSVAERRCVGRWKDDGGFGTCAMATDRWDKWTVVGSRTGVVNLYDDARWQGSEAEGGERKAKRAVENLVTGISTMRFNPDAQILALASRAKKDALKLVRLSSLSRHSRDAEKGLIGA